MTVLEVLNYINKSCWKDDSSLEELQSASLQAFQDLTLNKTQKKICYRVVGQSGSGKTSQLCFSLLESLKNFNEKPIVISVRFFAKYHKNYKFLLEKYGTENIREKTNGFALKCLTLTLEKIINEGYLLVFDLTLLSPIFEQYLFELLKKNNYKIEYHILAVNKKISNNFIEIRKKQRGEEFGRNINKSSKRYFYKILPISLKYLSKIDNTSFAYVWDSTHKNPICFGKLQDILKEFYISRKNKSFNLLDYKNLQEAKIKFFNKHLLEN